MGYGVGRAGAKHGGKLMAQRQADLATLAAERLQVQLYYCPFSRTSLSLCVSLSLSLSVCVCVGVCACTLL